MAQGIIKDYYDTILTKNMHRVVYIEPNRTTNINAYSVYDKEYTSSTLGFKGALVGYIVIGDKNTRLIVQPVSISTTYHTFRFYNPTNATQASQGLVIIAMCQY